VLAADDIAGGSAVAMAIATLTHAPETFQLATAIRTFRTSRITISLLDACAMERKGPIGTRD
jgi:hypothetical protein